MKLNGKELVTRSIPQFVQPTSSKKARTTIPAIRQHLLRGQLTPKPSGYGGPLLKRLLQFLGGARLLQIPGGHQQIGRSTEHNQKFFLASAHKQWRFPFKRREGVNTARHRAHFTRSSILSRVAQGPEPAPARIVFWSQSLLLDIPPRTVVIPAIHTLEDSLVNWLNEVLSHLPVVLGHETAQRLTSSRNLMVSGQGSAHN